MYTRIKNVSVNEEEFKRLYEKDGYGEEGISKKLGITVHVARVFIKKLGLKKHLLSRKGIVLWEETKQKISRSHIGKKLSSEHREKVIKTLRYGFKGKDNPNWKGGLHHQDGYVFVRMPNHPKVHSNSYIKRAILVAEKTLGRMLMEGEVTHHVNGIKDDDRPENIEVMSARAHCSLTAKESWKRGVFRRKNSSSTIGGA